MAERGWADRFIAFKQGFGYLTQSGIIFVALLGWARALLNWRNLRKTKKQVPLSAMLQLLTLALPIELALVLLGGRPRAPYFIALLPVLALLSGYALWLAQQWLRRQAGSR
ncbi:MAG: hypothetical protein WEC37_03095 [Anaerolineales bacterium]